MKAVELYYKPEEISLLLRVHVKTVVRWLKAREFGEVVNLGSEARPDYRVPSSGLQGWLDSRRVFFEKPGVLARSVEELRRKAA